MKISHVDKVVTIHFLVNEKGLWIISIASQSKNKRSVILSSIFYLYKVICSMVFDSVGKSSFETIIEENESKKFSFCFGGI